MDNRCTPPNQAPSGTITALSATGTRITSSGKAEGTIAGTATDSDGTVASVNIAIRRGTSGCDDWNGSAWTSTCTALTATYSAGAWSYSSTPPLASLTDGQLYRVWLLVTDNDGATNSWNVYRDVTYTSPNQAPTASSVRVAEPDYCASAPTATLTWSYSDPDGNAQSAYRVEIDDSSDFSSVVYNTGKIVSAATSHISSTLSYGTRYYARVRVWDSLDTVSSWATMTLCTGPGCAGDQQSWTTPTHAYPSAVNFTWSPTSPTPNQQVDFSTDTTTCYAVGGTPTACASYGWDFGDGSAPVAGPETTQAHAYADTGNYSVSFTATDADGHTCPAGSPLTKSISVQGNLPSWHEVAPQ